MNNSGAECVYDLCIIGAGMFGSAAARHATADPGLKVCLVGPAEPTVEERPERDVFASHYDEGRITRIPDEIPAFRILAKNSIGRYKELEEKSGIRFYNTVGCLFMGSKKSEFITNLVETGHSECCPLKIFTNENDLQIKYPFLKMKDGDCALLDDNGSGQISPRKMVMAQKKNAKSQGCDIIESEVIQITSDSVHEVNTVSMGTIKSKKILITTGAFTGLRSFEVLKPISLKRIKETVVLLNIPKEEAERLRSMPEAIKRTERNDFGAYILPPIQYPDGQYYLKFGKYGYSNADVINSLEEMKEWYLSEGNQDLINTHLNFVTELFQDLKFTSIQTMTCSTCYSPSGMPYIDMVSPTVAVAFAGNGKGAKFSDEVGRLAAKLCITGEWDSQTPQEQYKVVFKYNCS